MTDAKIEARDERKTPQTEKLLRQFLTLETGNFITKKFRENFDVATKGSTPIVAVKCSACDYAPNTVAEADWHQNRNKGHEFPIYLKQGDE
jgi:hypothetical protein